MVALFLSTMKNSGSLSEPVSDLIDDFESREWDKWFIEVDPEKPTGMNIELSIVSQQRGWVLNWTTEGHPGLADPSDNASAYAVYLDFIPYISLTTSDVLTFYIRRLLFEMPFRPEEWDFVVYIFGEDWWNRYEARVGKVVKPWWEKITLQLPTCQTNGSFQKVGNPVLDACRLAFTTYDNGTWLLDDVWLKKSFHLSGLICPQYAPLNKWMEARFNIENNNPLSANLTVTFVGNGIEGDSIDMEFEGESVRTVKSLFKGVSPGKKLINIAGSYSNTSITLATFYTEFLGTSIEIVHNALVHNSIGELHISVDCLGLPTKYNITFEGDVEYIGSEEVFQGSKTVVCLVVAKTPNNASFEIVTYSKLHGFEIGRKVFVWVPVSQQEDISLNSITDWIVSGSECAEVVIRNNEKTLNEYTISIESPDFVQGGMQQHVWVNSEQMEKIKLYANVVPALQFFRREITYNVTVRKRGGSQLILSGVARVWIGWPKLAAILFFEGLGALASFVSLVRLKKLPERLSYRIIILLSLVAYFVAAVLVFGYVA